jgi:tRNA A-37 threonylcarbamoyl transferase component Bud32
MGCTAPFFVSKTLCHVEEDHHELYVHVRHNGRLFFLMYHTEYFVRSPGIRKIYLEYLQEIRDDDGLYDSDAFNWLLKPFEALIMKLAPPVPRTRPATLAQYAFPDFYTYRLEAVDEKSCPKQVDKWAGWIPPGIGTTAEKLHDLKSWNRVYNPSQVILCYDRSEDVLVKPPHRVQLSNSHGKNYTSYFLKCFVEHGHSSQLDRELATFKKIAESNINAGARISRLHGVVATEDGKSILGLLLTWIDAPNGALQYQYWRRSLQARLRWAAQIQETIKELHEEGVVWGDAKLDNVLLDKDDTPWIVDFGGGYTPGWVDREKGETIEGDLQGLKRIVDKLSDSSPPHLSDFSSD